MVNLMVKNACVVKARAIMKNLGARAAAGYLRNRGVSLEGALWILLKKEVRA